MTKKPEKYFKELDGKINAAYKIAKQARSKNLDPETCVEAVPAGDLAARVEGLVGPKGIAEKIKKVGRENITQIIDSIISGEFGLTKEERIDQALRTSLAILTEGVVAAPIEGIAKIELNKNPDNTQYLSIYFSGPIRSAGGTAQGLAVLIAAYIQKYFKYRGFRPTDEIVARYIEEIRFYNDNVTNLQYVPSDEEIKLIVKNAGVCIDGEPTEKDKEVAVHRDVPGVHTNKIRGGMCLVVAEGMAQKAPKLMKKASDFGIDWKWLGEVEKLKIGKKGKEEGDDDGVKIKPIAKFMKETVGGRPIFAAPSSKGAFRLRYGRSRASGIAAKSIHPAAQVLLGGFIATGTQVRVERPGKGCIITPCNTIEGPIVKLKNGDVVRVESVKYAKKIKNKISEILFLGDLLVSYGDFLQTNHPLVPSGYCEEWWLQEIKKAGGEFQGIPAPEEALAISEKFNIPLHPRYTYHWEDVSFEELKTVVEWFSCGEIADGAMKIKNDEPAKQVLELLGVPHVVSGDFIKIEEYLILKKLFENINFVDDNPDYSSAFDFLSKNSKISIRKKVGTYIGARMGRPEKAKERKMQPAVHSLFPISDKGGRERSINVASEKNTVNVEVSRYECGCGKAGVFTACNECGKIANLRKICPNRECGKVWDENKKICPSCKTELMPYEKRDVNLERLWKSAVKNVGTASAVKGVKGMISAYKIPEHIEKGILRAKNSVFVFKDGTVRFDATDAPITHFKPEEIGVEIKYLNKLGYEKDYNGDKLNSENQIVELNVQDIIIPENGAVYLIRAAKFIDELLSKFYGIENFYNIQTKEDLLGHLVVGLAPHTSAGIIGRIVGFTQARVCYAHPYWHAAKRRNCFSPDTRIPVLENNDWKLISIKKLVEKNLKDIERDDFGTVYSKTKGLKTLTFNQETKKFEIAKISHVSRHAKQKIITLKTKSGREITTTPDHPFPTRNGKKLAAETEEVFVPLTINFSEKDVTEFNIAADTNDIMVKIPYDIFKRKNKRKIAERYNLNYKTFTNYVYRRSYPIYIAKDFIKKQELKKYKISAKQDIVGLPQTIKCDDNFMFLLGFYLAEGHIRKGRIKDKSNYQVSFAASNSKLKRVVAGKIEKVFGIAPNIEKESVTICSRIIYSFFLNLGTGKNAREKTVPNFVFSLPKRKIKPFLKGLFTGDGSVSLGSTLEVNLSSVSKKMIDEISFILSQFGIKHSFSAKDDGNEKHAVLHKIRIYSKYANLFIKKIGFVGDKQEKADKLVSLWNKKKGTERTDKYGDVLVDKIINKEFKKEQVVYSLTVPPHNTIIANGIVSHQCDGDEDTIMLLMDVLLNFSKKFLPESRGGKMDAPLVITTLLDPKEVDDEAHKMEIVDNYSIEFYEKTQEYVSPTDVKIKMVNDTLDNDPYNNLRFTHDTGNITGPVVKSKYVTLKSMKEKVDAQLSVAEKVRAIDERDVAAILINSHFLRDTYGNLRAFSRQKFRCVKCNQSYRRVPLVGKCTKCGGRLLLTVTEGSVRKYLEISKQMAEKYNLSDYLKQRLMLLDRDINSLFVNDLSKQASLSDFM